MFTLSKFFQHFEELLEADRIALLALGHTREHPLHEQIVDAHSKGISKLRLRQRHIQDSFGSPTVELGRRIPHLRHVECARVGLPEEVVQLRLSLVLCLCRLQEYLVLHLDLVKKLALLEKAVGESISELQPMVFALESQHLE